MPRAPPVMIASLPVRRPIRLFLSRSFQWRFQPRLSLDIPLIFRR
jgi:hypothetical protein